MSGTYILITRPFPGVIVTFLVISVLSSALQVFFSLLFFCSDPSGWKQILLHDYLNPSFKCAVYDFTLHCCTTQHHNGGQRCRFSVLSCKLEGFFFSVLEKKKKEQVEQVVADQIQIRRQSAEAYFISFGLIELLGI